MIELINKKMNNQLLSKIFFSNIYIDILKKERDYIYVITFLLQLNINIIYIYMYIQNMTYIRSEKIV